MAAFHQYKLSGHRQPTLCLAHSSHSCTSAPCCLLSGGEDGTMRCWDLRSSKASLCIISPHSTSAEVTSVAFHPSWGYNEPPTLDIPSYSRFALPFTVYVKIIIIMIFSIAGVSHVFLFFLFRYMSVGSHVYGYDLRKATSPIVRTYEQDVSPILQNKDEINQICFERKRGLISKNKQTDKIHLATADDAGDIRITAVSSSFEPEDKESKTGCTILSHTDSRMDTIPPLVTCIEYRPRVKEGVEIVSGGTDCTVRLWDATKPRKPPISTFQISRDDEMGVNQLCNPPIVHSVSWSSSGKLLACGLGDGSTLILSAEGRKLYESYRLRDGHTGTVATVLFPSFGVSKQSLHIQADDRLLFSAGNDGNILLWDLGTDVAGEKALNPCDMFSPGFFTVKDSSVDLTQLSLTSPPTVLLGISHQHKPNSLVSSSASDSIMPASLFVADTSNDITIYSFPVI